MFEKLARIIAETINVDPSDIYPEMAIQGSDGLSEWEFARMIIAAEREFKTRIYDIDAAGFRKLEEPFEDDQIGSSAMAYKRNPMRCERICSLSRYLINDAANAAQTASVQWLERTLDDSANRRISMPEAFLCADAVLRLLGNVSEGLRVNEKIIEKSVRDYLPFIATEDLLMEGVKRGGDRQLLHELIRKASMAATEKMKRGEVFDLLAELAKEPSFGMTKEEMEEIGRAHV